MYCLVYFKGDTRNHTLKFGISAVRLACAKQVRGFPSTGELFKLLRVQPSASLLAVLL